MKLIIGLGNPGEKYKNNRHNVGHMVVDTLNNKKTKKPKDFLAVKTNVFMNNSGEVVKHLVSKYPSILISSLYVVHDDLDIPLGQYKIQFAKGPKDHNGLLSIYESIGSIEFWHVRIGVDNRDPENRIPGEDYVLQDFDGEELNILESVIKKVVSELTKNA